MWQEHLLYSWIGRDRRRFVFVHTKAINSKLLLLKLFLKQLSAGTGNGIAAILYLWELNVWGSSPLRFAWNCIKEQSILNTITWRIFVYIDNGCWWPQTNVKKKKIKQARTSTFGAIVLVMAQRYEGRLLNHLEGSKSPWNTCRKQLSLPWRQCSS